MRLGLGLVVAVFLFPVSACSPKLSEPTGCAVHADCGAGALCLGGTCAASRPPTARVPPPSGPLLSHLRIRFDGSASDDPDAGDRVVAHAWRARAAVAPCEPVHPSGTEASFELLATCAGTFEVGLTVRDSVGVASAEVLVPVELFAHPAPPSASLPAGPILLGHRCAGAPLLCTALAETGAEAFALQATAASPTPGPFTWRWSSRPPAALPAAPRITFTPPDGPNPTVSIATDGTPIAGSYHLTVEATDGLGVVASAQVEVTVGNRPPEPQVAGSPLLLPHTFQASPPRFIAEGAVPEVAVVDPDGDPVTTAFAFEEAGVSAPTMTVTAVGAAAVFRIVVPASGPDQLLAPRVSRTLRFRAADGNGGAAEVSWPIAVENRPPRRVGPFSTAAAHAFDPVSGQYRASPILADYVDDDGDPLAVSASTGDTTCPALAFLAGQLRAECAAPYSGTPAAAGIAGLHAFLVTVSDPWSSLAAESTSVTIGNRAPALSAPDVSARCSRRSCCEYDAETRTCLQYDWLCPEMNGSLAVAVSDPDGDPLTVTWSGGSSVVGPCPGGSCELSIPYSRSGSTICAWSAPTAATQVEVSDGLVSTSLSVPLWR